MFTGQKQQAPAGPRCDWAGNTRPVLCPAQTRLLTSRFPTPLLLAAQAPCGRVLAL